MSMAPHSPLSNTWHPQSLTFQKDCAASDPCTHNKKKKGEKEKAPVLMLTIY